MTKEQVRNENMFIIAPNCTLQHDSRKIPPPKRPELASYESRLRTFTNWPLGHPFTKEEFAEAGLYYAGYSDCTRCYYCGGAVRNWQQEDHVWLEHARWFPCCSLVVERLGAELVEILRVMQKRNQKITFESVMEELQEGIHETEQLSNEMKYQVEQAMSHD